MKLFHKHEFSPWREYEKVTHITLFDRGTALVENRKSRHCVKCGFEEDTEK